MVVVFWRKPETRLAHRVLFNMAAPSISVWMAGTAFYLLSGIEPYSKVFTPLPSLFFPLLVFTAVYFLLNSWLVAVAVGLENHRSPAQIWWKNFAWLSVNYFSGASLAALIVTYTQQLDLSALAVIVPLLVVSYLTFRTAMGRAEDSFNHLTQLNRLYLSTIETLAMAIDAKDQITHGHIRRVQTYAVGLARNIGVSDDKLLKAIEAAALLHDMGKLAVPEHILNKPGKLTPAEFEKMKLHASVGADILSAIDFPYPVVPIVRHHHENWNGTGYPDGIKGTDIPIGARILSVVDCFDALTSDRPYRPRLSDEEAVTILLERRGSMYDPLVVDTFIRVHREIAPELILPAETRATLQEITGSSLERQSNRIDLGLDDSGEQTGDETFGPSLAAALAGQHSVSETAETVARFLRRAVPFSLSILYLYDVERDELMVAHVTGEASGLVRDLRISSGDRLSGWVAANRQPIVNSDPMLDLGEISKATTPPLRTSLSVPLLVGSELVGVFTLYSATERFDEQHRRFTEAAAREAAQAILHVRESVPVRA
jgi:putative nucleotidyltransferase with HDIG domain